MTQDGTKSAVQSEASALFSAVYTSLLWGDFAPAGAKRPSLSVGDSRTP